MYTKSTRQVVRGVGPDEWLALFTVVCKSNFARDLRAQMLTSMQIVTAGVTADIIVGNRYGMGKHLSSSATPAQLEAILMVRTLPPHPHLP